MNICFNIEKLKEFLKYNKTTMFSIQKIKNRIHCDAQSKIDPNRRFDVCNKFYIDYNYKRHLKSNKHINNFIKKQKVTNIILTDKICNASHLSKTK